MNDRLYEVLKGMGEDPNSHHVAPRLVEVNAVQWAVREIQRLTRQRDGEAEKHDAAADMLKDAYDELSQLRATLERARPILLEYARANPLWFDSHSGTEQDANGVHALLWDMGLSYSPPESERRVGP